MALIKTCIGGRNTKRCAFCENWIGDAEIQWSPNGRGVSYNSSARGKCLARCGALVSAGGGIACSSADIKCQFL